MRMASPANSSSTATLSPHANLRGWSNSQISCEREHLRETATGFELCLRAVSDNGD